MKQITVMLGGNLPDTRKAMETALEKFAAAGVSHILVSSVISSQAVDCVPDTPDFLDAGFTGFWDKSAEELLDLCQKIEIEAGRPAVHSSRESRILDCDIIFFGDDVIESSRLTIPHPRAKEREFVLVPLAEIVPEQKFPDGESVAEKLKKLEGVVK